jgi:hypothetical protein
MGLSRLWPLRRRNSLAAVYSWLSSWPLSAQSEIAQRAFGAFLVELPSFADAACAQQVNYLLDARKDCAMIDLFSHGFLPFDHSAWMAFDHSAWMASLRLIVGHIDRGMSEQQFPSVLECLRIFCPV